jgi:hypothetical protein
MKKLHIIFLTAVILLLASCSPEIDTSSCVEGVKIYNGWYGLWHGICAPFTFIGNLFGGDWIIYATNNSGGWYDFGFLLGIGAFGGGASRSTRRNK